MPRLTEEDVDFDVEAVEGSPGKYKVSAEWEDLHTYYIHEDPSCPTEIELMQSSLYPDMKRKALQHLNDRLERSYLDRGISPGEIRPGASPFQRRLFRL